jgi:hypothetical protein
VFKAEEAKPEWRPLEAGSAKSFVRCPDCDGKLTLLRHRDKDSGQEACNAMARA